MEQDPEMNLQKVTEECQKLINVKRDTTRIERKVTSQVQVVKQKTFLKNKGKSFECWSCAGSHLRKNCPFKDQPCAKCGLVGHRASQCRTKQNKQRQKFKSKVNVVLSKEEVRQGGERKFVNTKINGHIVKLLLDTGSDISIIDEVTWKRIGCPKLEKTSKIAKGVSGKRLKFKGEFNCSVSLGSKIFSSKVSVVPGINSCLFGIDWIVLFDLWELPINSFCNRVSVSEKKNSKQNEDFLTVLKSEFPRVFSVGLGVCTKTEVNFVLKQNVKPVFKPKRNVPFSSKEDIEIELQRLQENGVVEKNDYSEWASRTVYVKKKNKKIWVCADFSTGLNDCLMDHSYPLPSPEDIFTKLNGGKIFSKIGLSEAYLQVKVSEECSKYLCIITHLGLFRLKRLPFGLKVAPALFQQIMDTMLADLGFAIAYLDDILVKSKNVQEHKEHIRTVFQRIEEFGFKLSAEKCEFFLKQIKYLGQIIDSQGRRPDPQRTEAIEKMPAPNNVAQLQSFLGLAQYYAIYIPKMHKLRAPLNELLKKRQKWIWSKECQSAFEEIKKCLLSDLALAHFDPQKELIVASDASDYGLGAVLLHRLEDGSTKPIAHASRSLLPAERNYSQIEKESLAIIYAIKKFHRFIHGRIFTLQTDHKPLLTIFGSKKGIPTHTANRLQRWSIILLNYNFKMEYISSKNIGHADGLSRLILKCAEPLEDTVIAALRGEKELSGLLCNTIRELPVTLDDINKAAETDEFIVKMKKQVQLNEKSKKDLKISPFVRRL